MVHGNEIQVADIINCRVLWLGQNRRIVHAVGTAGDCVHDPPHALLEPTVIHRCPTATRFVP
jgi:hypothetical protein